MRIFLLEDDPSRQFRFVRALVGHAVTLCENCEGAKVAWHPPYDVVSLDHDLGLTQMMDVDGPNTGSAFTSWLTSRLMRESAQAAAGRWFIHSFNPAGAAAMRRDLEEIGITPIVLPFSKALITRILDAPFA